MKAIEVKDLHFQYDTQEVLKGVSFSLEEGSYVAILGHNGSGKSTLAKLLIGLLEKKSGSIKIFDKELNLENLYKIRDEVGIVFQNPDNQFIGSTVRDDIAFGLENHCVEHEQMDPIIESFAQRVGMTKFLESEPTQLSGGQKQRVAIAGVLAMSPKIIVFDESTSMLDPDGKREINDLIRKIHKERNITIITITHDIEEAVKADYVMVLADGQIIRSGKPSEVLTNEKKLIENHLDIPFTLQLRKALAEKGIKLDEVLTLDEMAEQIWQLSLKK